MKVNIGMSLTRLVFAIYDESGHVPSKIKIKSRYMTSLKKEFGIEEKSSLTKFLGIPLEELSDGNSGIVVIED